MDVRKSKSVPFYSRLVRPKDSGFDFSEPVVTEQNHASALDRNVMIAKFIKGQALPNNVLEPLYADVSDIGQFQDAFERVSLARDTFASLPSKIRSRFGNDAALFADFCLDPANAQELVSMGLATARQEDPAPKGGQPPVPPAGLPEAPGVPDKPKV